MIQTKTNEQKTNKQGNIFTSTISQPNQVGSSRNCQKNILCVSQDDSNKKENKPINKQKNKQTNKHFLDSQYLSQVKSDLCKTFNETSCGCPMIIKRIHKQTKKQKKTNKHFKILNISAKSSWIFAKFLA